MAKALKTIGKVAAVVALVATVALGPANPVTVAASLIATASNIGAQLLAKPPPARGSLTSVLVAVDPPQPYVMGRGLFAGVNRYDHGYGATLKKVPNPYLWLVDVYSGGGPVAGIVPWADKAAITAYFDDYLYTDTKLGACPDTALTPHFAGAPGWNAASKLSGQAAIGWNPLFDKDGKRFASGLPVRGAYGDWVLAYDPRKDSTFPGGSGAHRIGVESTYEWTEWPALHFGTYAYGRFQNGKRTIGCGFPADSIDWAAIAAWANVCEANEWSIFGAVFEPGNRYPNLQEIAMAGGARPVVTAGKVSVVFNAPRVPTFTITEADLAADPVEVTAQASYADRINTIIPKWTSPGHDWQQIAGTPISVASFVTEDGEEKTREWPFNLVKSDDGRQPAELALYQLWNARELQPIVMPLKHHMRRIRAGECGTCELPEKGLEIDVIVLQKQFDPATLQPVLICMTETTAKHAFILGEVSTPPPTPALGQTAAQRDAIAAQTVLTPTSGAHRLISYDPLYPLTSDDVSISVAAFDGVTDDGRTIAFAAGSVTGLTASTAYNVFWDGAAYSAAVAPATAEMADSDLVFIGYQATDDGAGTYPGGTTPPGGWGGGGGGYEP